MATKDTLSQISGLSLSDSPAYHSINNKVGELKTRDEELAAKIQFQSVSASVEDLTGRHTLGNISSVDLVKLPGLFENFPEYYKLNKFTLPEVFSSTNLAYIYSFSNNELVFGSSSNTYVYSIDSNTIISTRPRSGSELNQGTLQYGYFKDQLICNMFDGSLVKFKVPDYYGSGVRPIINNVDNLLTIVKSDNTIINITTQLPAGKQLVTVIGCSDGHSFIVFTSIAGSTAGGVNCNAWHKFYWDGTTASITDTGLLDSNNSINEYTSSGLTGQNFYGSACMEPGGEYIWCIEGSSGVVELYKIYSDKILRKEAGFGKIPITNAVSDSSSSIASSNSFAVIKGDQLTILRRRGVYYTATPSVAIFAQQSDNISVNSNLADFNFDVGDFCINILFKTSSSGKQMLFYTDTLSISVEDWTGGKGSIQVRSKHDTFFSPSRLEPNKLQRLIIERNSGSLFISINHIEIPGDTFSGKIETPTVCYIGYNPNDYTYNFDGYISYLHITKATRNSKSSIPSEPLVGSVDPLWAQTVLYAVPSISGKIARRELLKVSFNPNNTIADQFLPTGWTIKLNYTGSYTITHNIGDANYIVIPSSSSAPIITNIESNYFNLSTYNRNGSLVTSNFSCFVIQY